MAIQVTFDRFNPITGEVGSSAPAMKASEIPGIAAKGPNARRAVLMKAAAALEAKKEDSLPR